MRTLRLLICAGACSSALTGPFAAADAVDDLLAGKPVVIAPADPDKAPTPAQDRILERMLQEQTPADDSLSGESLEVKLTDPSSANLEISRPSGEAMPLTTTNTGNLTLVPEPSAIILVVSSLVYFLIFFRRRYSF